MSTISSSTTSTTAYKVTADTTGTLVIQTGATPTTAVTVGTDQSFNFSATGQRITGDFSNATVANRVMFQTSTTNGNTVLNLIPNGTGTICAFGMDSDPALTNSSTGSLNLVASTDVRLSSSIRGTGTYLPMTFYTGGSERMRVDTSGNVGIGTTSPSTRLHTYTASGENKLIVEAGAASQSATLSLQTNNTTPGACNIYMGKTGASTNGQVGYDPNNNFLYLYTNNTERMRIDSSGNLLFNSGYGSVATAYGCRAWVNFNGTGTVAIRASANVTSITDNGVGDYTVNFTNAMPDGNYAYHIGSKQDQAGVGDAAFPTNGTPTGVTDGAAGMTTTRIRLRFVNLDGTASLRDQEVVCVSIFR